MAEPQHLWAIVLAAGEGRRLRSVVAGDSHPRTPKQYRVLDGRESMLRWTIRRAVALVPQSRVVVVVASEHRRWWESELSDLAADNVVVQPRNKGTAAGILLPLLTVLERDPEADVLVLPSDHYVEQEERLREALKQALEMAHSSASQVILVGVRPAEDTADYGWIVPGSPCPRGPLYTVSAFKEKPDRRTVARLLDQGAVVNSLMLAARGRALLELFFDRAPELVEELGKCFEQPKATRTCLDRLYERLESTDFSRQVLEPVPERLLVQAVGAECGWIDLGTPARLHSYLERHLPAG